MPNATDHHLAPAPVALPIAPIWPRGVYLNQVCRYLRSEFPRLPTYQRCVELLPRCAIALAALFEALTGKCSGVSIADSTPISVCKNLRIPRHRVFQGMAARGKSSTGWFFGFQLSLVINHLGELLGVKLTPGNVDDRKPLCDFAERLFGKRYADNWRFHNGFGLARVYLMNRKLEGQIAENSSYGFDFMDELNPRLLSNNFLLPYMVAVWEEYFRATFAACFKYSPQRAAALKRARLGHGDLEKVVIGSQPIERAIAESFSFQRPGTINENFRMLDQKLDVGGAMRKPYRRRKKSLFDSIEQLVEDRNEFVHTGGISIKFFDGQLNAALSDMEVAVNRAYECIAAHYHFVPSHDY